MRKRGISTSRTSYLLFLLQTIVLLISNLNHSQRLKKRISCGTVVLGDFNVNSKNWCKAANFLPSFLRKNYEVL